LLGLVPVLSRASTVAVELIANQVGLSPLAVKIVLAFHEPLVREYKGFAVG
jgi:hypothetical protein